MADLIAIGKIASDSRMTAQASDPASQRLELLLVDVAQAIDQQDIKKALRLADRARRIAPKNPTCILLYARLLLEAGLGRHALTHLQDNDDPEVLLVRGLALFELGLLAEASECCQRILRRFSLNAVTGISLLASRVCRAKGSNFSLGWVGTDDHLNLIGEARGDCKVIIGCSDGSCSPVRSKDRQGEWIPFSFSLPPGVSGPLQIRGNDCELLGSGLQWPPEFRPSAWVAVEGKILLGEAHLEWSPKRRLELSIGRSSVQRTITTTLDASSGTSSFSTPLLPSEWSASELDVAIVLPDGKYVSPIGSPLFPSRRLAANVGQWPNPKEGCFSSAKLTTIGEASRIIDIIVPVYAGRQETLDCLQSVLRTADLELTEIIVVDDASADPELCEAMASFATDNRITLLTNSCNLGYAGAVNRGIRLHPDRDVVLLNSDTQVFGDWIKRLVRAAYSSHDIGTVTPFGQGGSITDYSQADPLINDFAKEIDRLASKVNAGRVVDIPVGVGFCTYIKRACLDQTGELDALTFGRGYGEENDLCLRARNLGWRHVAATDIFVAHHGGRSFQGSAKVHRKRNSLVLNALFPGYAALIEVFSAADPLLEARRAIDISRLPSIAHNPVLLITHDLSGGVERHISHREVELSDAGHTVLVLQRSTSDESTTRVALRIHSPDLENLFFDVPKDLLLLEQVLGDLCLSHVELHHFLRLPPSILALATRLAAPYDVYIHDYAWICPRIALINGTGRYCGEPPLSGCENCIKINGSALEESLTVSELRDRSAMLLKKARRVIVPSNDARERLAQYFPAQQFTTTPWQSVASPKTYPRKALAGRVRIAIIGAIGLPKGYEVLLQCARDAAARDLNLEFVVIGYTVDDQSLLDTGRVFITGPYEEDEVITLLDREDCSAAFFPSVAPETWCYSLTHAITYGLPIIAFNLGAQAERLRTYRAAELLPTSLSPQQINYSLINWDWTLGALPDQHEKDADRQADNTDRALVEDTSQELVTSVQVLRLPVGIYTFTVRDDGPVQSDSETLALPALQVGIAPARSSGNVEFLTGGSSVERWLAYRTDMVVVRIMGGDASLMLTSMHKQDSPSLEINMERLGAHDHALAPEVKSLDLLGDRAIDLLAVRLMAHIRYIGDLQFDAGYAGWVGHKMWIEGFAVSAIGDLTPSSVEYRGLAANGLQTPWLSNQALCGSRGGGLPLLGYAVRLRGEFAKLYKCSYTGRFFSGAKVGPLENGALCSSDLPNDPLEAIELRVTERQRIATSVAGPGQLQTKSDGSERTQIEEKQVSWKTLELCEYVPAELGFY